MGIVRRKLMLVTIGTYRVKLQLHSGNKRVTVLNLIRQHEAKPHLPAKVQVQSRTNKISKMFPFKY